ncbi:hypothetical protein J4E05_14350 [Thalassospira sp. NFXS8]|uniref:hypothetical protein n=1 Tax=Thalassospira sp. NFXS8 TaxID=2819093 RepID=UPI0032E007C9
MEELIEVVLEDVPHGDLLSVVMYLVKDYKNVVDVQCSEHLSTPLNCQNIEDVVVDFTKIEEGAALILRLNSLDVAGEMVPSVLLRVVKYEEKYDVDFNFSESDLKRVEKFFFIRKLQFFTSEVAKKYKIPSFFCGVEPASDEDTRYFTGQYLGPLR